MFMEACLVYECFAWIDFWFVLGYIFCAYVLLGLSSRRNS